METQKKFCPFAARDEAVAFGALRAAEHDAATNATKKAGLARVCAYWVQRVADLDLKWFKADAHVSRRDEVFASLKRCAEDRARAEIVTKRESREAARRAALGMNGDHAQIKSALVRSPTQSGAGLGVQMEQVARNIKHDILEYEYAHKHIDDAQKLAGERVMAAFERSGIGGAKALDYGQAKVDSSPKNTVVSEMVLDAIDELNRIERRLGPDDYKLLIDTICFGKKVKEVASARYAPYLTTYARTSAESHVGRLWRDALKKVADMDCKPGRSSPIRVDRHVPLHFGMTG